MDEDDFIAKRSPGRLALLLLGSLLLVAGSAWLTWRGVVPGWKYWAVAAGLPFFGLTTVVAVSMFFAEGPVVAVGPRGILWRRWTGDYVPWEVIAAVRPVQVVNQPMLAITLTDPAAYPLRGIQGRLQSANRSMMGGGDVFITLTGTDRTFSDLVAAIHRFAPTKAQH